ncbi:MAG: AIPR family protein [Myxococcota bacterium]
MSEIHMRHIQRVLSETFEPHVDVSDLAKRGRGAPEPAKLSRALAAFGLRIASGLEPRPACAQIVDGFQDNGIDAVYYDEHERCVYLVQAKWIQSGEGGIDSGEVSKFLQGVRDLQRARFERFNDKFRAHHVALAKALDDPKTRFEVILVTTSAKPVSPACKRLLEDFVVSVNDVSEIVLWRYLGQAELYKAVAQSIDVRPIDLEVMLQDWGQVAAPFRAFYGQVSVADVARWWNDHRHQLFSKNLRSFLGDSAVNEAIADTLVSQPERFWYLNNGLTILCTEIAKKPMGGDSRSTGIFVCKGVAVVNGAQTVGTIGRTRGEGVEGARVMVRLISLAEAHSEFANAVTRATNTQNRIESRDFAALDDEQRRLKLELSLEGVNYAYRSGEPNLTGQDGCTIEEATVALACAADDIQLTVQAKGNIGRLWADITLPPYTTIFNGALPGVRLWRCVKVLRQVEGALEEARGDGVDVRRQVAVHGNRFIARQVFRTLRGRASSESEDVAGLAVAVLDRLEHGLDEVLQDTYIAWAFKTPSKCEALERDLFGDLFAEPVRPVSAADRQQRAASRASRQISLFGPRL